MSVLMEKKNMMNLEYLAEKAMAPHSSTLAWKIPWTEEPGGLQSMGSQGVGHNWATSLSLFTFMHWRRKWQPTPVFLLGESQGRGAWWAATYGVAQSRTWLKRLSSSGSSRVSWKFRAYGCYSYGVIMYLMKRDILCVGLIWPIDLHICQWVSNILFLRMCVQLQYGK